MKSKLLKCAFLLCVILVVTALFALALLRMDIDTDIINTMPTDDPVIAESAAIFLNSPIQNQFVVDIAIALDDADTLAACAGLVEKRLKDSALFESVGSEGYQGLMPEMIDHVLANLPVLFSARELKTHIQPLLGLEEIRRRLKETRLGLLSLGSIGQAEAIGKDPLDLRGIVLSRLAPLIPSNRARIYQGNLISGDGRHLLLSARPLSSGTDTGFARQVTDLIKTLPAELRQATGTEVTLTPLGAYRAALDNEEIIRADVTRAIILATAGIAILLVFTFPRPLIGLLSLLPAVAGTMLAFFAFSLFHDSISIMVLGFGGAVISITVDHGIAFLLFMDQPRKTFGREASREVWSVGLLAVLTSMGAFGALCFSGFPVFAQLGQFTALGIGFSFLFVHLVFPWLFPNLAPAKRRFTLLYKCVDLMSATGPMGAWAAVAFAAVMVFLAKPVFDVSLQSMNTVSAETMAAEELMTRVWGEVLDKVYLMTEGRSLQELQGRGDQLADRLDRDFSTGVLSSGFVLSGLFPGEKRRAENFAAWKNFWSDARIQKLKADVADAGTPLGFASKAFTPFYDVLGASSYTPRELEIPPEYYAVFGISQNADRSRWFQVSTLDPGPGYDPEQFRREHASSGKLFDPAYFSQRLGSLLFGTFTRLLILVSLSVAVLLLLFFVDLKLTAAALLPVVFALISTLGTLKLLNRPVDIPGLMLSIVVLGMGIDYSLFFVRSFQRYGSMAHPLFGLVRMSVFMASLSTLIGFGALCAADHSLLRSAGLTSFLGIGYSLLGAFLILPPLLEAIQGRRMESKPANGTLGQRVLNRYRNMEAYPRLFARFKLRCDAMFTEMEEFFQPDEAMGSIIDIGCGFGVPGSWMLERFPTARLYGIEPSPERVRIATRALADRGAVTLGSAPDIAPCDKPADLALMLDMLHFLDQNELMSTLKTLRESMQAHGRLIVRMAIEPKRHFPWQWWLENLKLRLLKVPCTYRRPEALERAVSQAGFRTEMVKPSGARGELVWLIARAA